MVNQGKGYNKLDKPVSMVLYENFLRYRKETQQLLEITSLEVDYHEYEPVNIPNGKDLYVYTDSVLAENQIMGVAAGREKETFGRVFAVQEQSVLLSTILILPNSRPTAWATISHQPESVRDPDIAYWQQGYHNADRA
uniref:Uncharacterized protein n=1 Tax=Romanomermis culicivorax TaxID=13658 RepID=A0A915IG03_ROMCU